VIEAWKRALVLAPHTDDGELGCGGTMARLVDGGCEVRYVAFSIATRSLPPGFEPDTLAREVREATGELGIKEEQLTVHDFDVRTFPDRRQDILELLVALWEEWKPDVVFQPSHHDVHQDHQTIAQEGLRAFKRTTLFGYEVPRNNFDFSYGAYSAREKPHRAQGPSFSVSLAAASALRRSRVHLESRTRPRRQREPRIRGVLPGLPDRRLELSARGGGDRRWRGVRPADRSRVGEARAIEHGKRAATGKPPPASFPIATSAIPRPCRRDDAPRHWIGDRVDALRPPHHPDEHHDIGGDGRDGAPIIPYGGIRIRLRPMFTAAATRSRSS
jgi:LmbE family N-acetylglucosaminyl deacetylase